MKYVLLFFCFSSVFGAFAQQVTVSEPLNVRSDMGYEIIGTLQDNLLLFRDRSTLFEVQSYTAEMELGWVKELELDKRRPQVLGLTSDKKTFTILYQKRFKGDLILKAHKYDAGANLLDSVVVVNLGRPFYTPDFQIELSEDRQKMLIYYFDQAREFHAKVFDVPSMRLDWETQFEPADMVLIRDYRQTLVDNDGNVYLVLERDNRKSKQDNHHYEVYRYGPSESMRANSVRVAMDGMLTYDVFFNYDNLNRQLVAGGLYSDGNRGRAEGVFYLRVDNFGQRQGLQFHPFDDVFIADLVDRNPEKTQKGLTQAVVREIVLRRDGGILLIGERSREQERNAGTGRSYSNGYGGRYVVDYFYEDLFVVSLHPDGDLHWKNVLHKKQYSQDDDAIYSSYLLAKTPSSLRLLFNDEIKQNNTVSEYVVRGDGHADRNSVMSTANQQLRLRFRDGVQVAANELIVPSERRTRLKLVRVKY